MSSDKKELIRESATKIMAREGFHNTKAAQIAGEAGIAVGTIYNYFSSKEEILEYIFEVELQKRLEKMRMIEDKEISNLERLAKFLHWHFQEISSNPDTGRILVREKEFPRKNRNAAIHDYLYDIPRLIESMLQEGLQTDEIKNCSPEVVAPVIFGGVQGLVEKAIYDNNLSLLDKAADEIINLLTN